MLGKIRKIHFVGIGGIGMSGIAEVLLNLGFEVSGSDQKATPVTQRLADMGARVFEGHAAEHVSQAQVVVVSSAVRPDNPEIQEAYWRQIPVIPRAEMLAELMRMKFSVAVAGAHGKTSVTSMIAVMTAEAKLDPTAVIGGRLDVFGSSARLGKSDLMVVEADESDRSFLLLLPAIAVVTNIDREHLDHYRDLDEIASAFVSFMNKVPFYGAVVVCFDPPWRAMMQNLIPTLRRRVVTYGIEPGADIQGHLRELTPAASVFDAVVKGEPLGTFSIHVPGRHNVQNALAAVAVGLELGLTAERIRQGLEKFRGADRRFQIKGEINGITIVDDYGHHPTEIRATLDAARLRAAKRVIAIFQPHRYTRTNFLLDELAGSLAGCDRVYVLDIYAASEAPIPGVNAERLVARMHELGVKNAQYAPSEEQIVKELAHDAQPGDLIITIGAGSVWKIGEALAKELGVRSQELKRTKESQKAKRKRQKSKVTTPSPPVGRMPGK
ncbi:MAG TPA: UDP-N-acetylmuramate--L-alanine ligase [Terriglobia bacterium]|nr:UDP-N-acetylmuramate--L-alanine ligase [Terriglobia bacterium]